MPTVFQFESNEGQVIDGVLTFPGNLETERVFSRGLVAMLETQGPIITDVDGIAAVFLESIEGVENVEYFSPEGAEPYVPGRVY